MRSRGFTLIELLVVMAIVSILAAILFPVFSKARLKVNGAVCESNLKQITMAVLLYAEDYDGKFPNLPPRYTWYGDSWASKLVPYLKNTKVFTCPNDTRKPYPWYSQYPYGDQLISYSYSSWLAGNMESTIHERILPNDDGIELSRVQSPAAVILLHDTPYPDPYTTMANPPYTRCFLPGAYTHSYRHSDGDNYSFADGHVKWYQVSASVGGPFEYTDTEHKISFDYRYEP